MTNVVILEDKQDMDSCAICGKEPEWLIFDCLPCCETCREKEYSHLEVIE